MRYNVWKFSKYHCERFFCWLKKCQLHIHVMARVVYFLHVGWGARLLKIVKIVLHAKVNIVLTLKISIWLHLLEEPHLNLFSKNFTFFTFSLAGIRTSPKQLLEATVLWILSTHAKPIDYLRGPMHPLFQAQIQKWKFWQHCYSSIFFPYLIKKNYQF